MHLKAGAKTVCALQRMTFTAVEINHGRDYFISGEANCRNMKSNLPRLM